MFCWEKFGEVYQQSRIRYFESCLSLIRRHPDLNWGKRICSPPPYRSAMPPKRYKIDANLPPLLVLFGGITKCLFFIVLPYEILFALIPCLKELCPFFWSRPIPSIDFIVSQNTQYRNPSLFYWKTKCVFSITKAKIKDKLEPLTIDCKFLNDSWISILNCVSLML